MIIGLLIQPNPKLSQEGINKLLNKEITLKDAYELFKEKEASLGEVIAFSYSFQNIESLNKTLSGLIGKDFLTEVENIKVFDLDGNFKFILKNKYPHWRKYLQELFSLRHKFTHQISFKDKLGLNRVGILWENLDAFIEAADSYLLEFVPET